MPYFVVEKASSSEGNDSDDSEIGRKNIKDHLELTSSDEETQSMYF